MIMFFYTRKFVFLGAVVALFLWIIEVIFHVAVFKTGNFFEELIPVNDLHELWMRIVTVTVVLLASGIAQYMANKITRAYEKERELNKKLEDSINEIRILRGILPICASCKKIRDDKGYWNQIEEYLEQHSEAQFSHGLCPECTEKLYPEFTKKHSKNN